MYFWNGKIKKLKIKIGSVSNFVQIAFLCFCLIFNLAFFLKSASSPLKKNSLAPEEQIIYCSQVKFAKATALRIEA